MTEPPFLLVRRRRCSAGSMTTTTTTTLEAQHGDDIWWRLKPSKSIVLYSVNVPCGSNKHWTTSERHMCVTNVTPLLVDRSLPFNIASSKTVVPPLCSQQWITTTTTTAARMRTRTRTVKAQETNVPKDRKNLKRALPIQILLVRSTLWCPVGMLVGMCIVPTLANVMRGTHIINGCVRVVS